MSSHKKCRRLSPHLLSVSRPLLSPCVLLGKTNITSKNSRGAAVILRVSGALCGPVLMSHMWPVKKDPSDLPIRLITTQYILMSRVTSYTYNIHIHSTHAGSYMYLDDTDMTGLLVILPSSLFFSVLFYYEQLWAGFFTPHMQKMDLSTCVLACIVATRASLLIYL